MSRQLTFTEFVDFILVRLYERDRADSSNHRFDSISEIASELANPVPFKWVHQALQVLDEAGWVKDWGSDNGFFGEITGQGRLYVEGREHKTRVIEEYRLHPTNFVLVTGSHNQVAVGNVGDVTQVSLANDDRAQALAILSELRATLEADSETDDLTRRDALADVDAIEGQLAKQSPNRAVIQSLLQSLGSIASVAQLAVQIGQILS